MDKDLVIKLRTALKGNKNIPLKIYLDNLATGVDESAVGQFTLWDDDNGIIYAIRLPDMQQDYSPDNRSRNISIYAGSYEYIQGMEIALLPLTEIDNVVATIKDSGKDISNEMVNLIKNTYENILKQNITEISHEKYNKLVGSSLDTDDDYYNGKLTVNQDVLLRQDRNKLGGN